MNSKLVKGFSLSLVAVAVMTLSACNGDKEQSTFDASKANFDQKASYAIGAVLGQQVSQLQKTQGEYLGAIDKEIILAGFSDAIKEHVALKDNELQETLQALEQKVSEGMNAKQQKSAQENLKKGEEFLAANAKKEGVVTTKSGLQYKVIKEGTGPKAKIGDVINVTYKGTTIDGTVFDEQKDPVDFTLENMIPGWIEALQLMSKGSEYELAIPASLAYGEHEAGPFIAPNSVLLFKVSLVDIKKAK